MAGPLFVLRHNVGVNTTATSPTPIRQSRYRPPAGSCTILLVRHGESEAAVPGQRFDLVDGQGDPDLHPIGRRQTQLAADRLQRGRVDAIYVTTLRRTHQSAAPLAEALGMVPTQIADLREVHLGEWEGGEYRLRAAMGDPIHREMHRQRRWEVIPGAENTDDFAQRVHRGILTISRRHPDQHVVVYTHGGVIGQLVGIATGADSFEFYGSANASITELVIHDDQFRLRRFNDTAHLEGLDPEDF